MMDKDKALEAYRLWQQHGRDNRTLALRLGLKTAAEAYALANAGRRWQEMLDCAFTADEIAVIEALAILEREAILRGQGSPKAKHVCWKAGHRDGWAQRVCKKRLMPEGFVDHSRNGHIRLLRAGWSVAAILDQAAEERMANAGVEVVALDRSPAVELIARASAGKG